MNSERQLVQVDRLPAVAELESVGEAGIDERQNQPSRLLRIARERLVFAIILGAIGLVGGGLAGFLSTEPEFRAEGVIDIAPFLNTSLDDRSVLPMFHAFVETQAAAIRSPRVQSMAMDSEPWRSMGRGVSPKATREFRKELVILHPIDTRMLVVWFTDPDPNAAMVAVNSTMDAYVAYGKESEVLADGETIKLFRKHLQLLQDQLKAVQADMLEIVKEYGNKASLESRYNAKQQELLRLEATRNSLELELVELESGGNRDEQGNAMRMTVTEISVKDVRMRELVRERRELRREVSTLRGQGLGEKNKELASLLQQLDELEGEIEEYAISYRKLQGRGLVGNLDRIRKLKAKHAAVLTQHSNAAAEVATLSAANFEIQELGVREEDLRMQIKEDEFRIAKEQLEAAFSGRIDVLSRAELPSAPHKDKRMQMAVLGGVAGGGAGFLIVILLGLLDRRCRTSEDVQETVQRYRLLGMVPSLKLDSEKAENLRIGTHCLHHVRTVLQVGVPSDLGQTVAITSPSAETGKTTLTAALGFSFSSSGSRTLLIDCDLIGRGLTSLMDTIILERIERLLEFADSDGSTNGHDPAPFALTDVLHCARRGPARVEKERLEEVLRICVEKLGFTRAKELGILDGLLYVGARGARTLEELPVVRALRDLSGREDGGRVFLDPAVISGHPLGLNDALQEEKLEECIRSTGIPRLSVLTIRSGEVPEVGQLSPAVLSRIIDQARTMYDTVLIDTGPILGSLEASIVSTKVDGVVLAVSRGEQQALVEKALGNLSSLGANTLGLVFNKARIVDVIRSSRPLTTRHQGVLP